MSSKSRVSLRLKEKVGKKAKNRRGDLVALADRFGVLKAKIAHLVAALHAQHGSMDTLLRTRLEVAKQVASISEKSPIFDHAGLLPGTETPKGAVTSYYSVHLAMHKRSTMYLDRYKQFIVDYATEWENVVVTRVSNDIKASEKIRLDLEHYPPEQLARMVAKMTLERQRAFMQRWVSPSQAVYFATGPAAALDAIRQEEGLPKEQALPVRPVPSPEGRDAPPTSP